MYFSYTIIIANLYLILNKCLGQSDDEYPVVTIESGEIRGRINYTVGENIAYYAFKGIPYAEPPIGNLRFAAPQKISNWTGILNTIEERSLCVQESSPVVGSEDCLFINLATPSLEGANRSVMVYIYGGGWIVGNSSFETYGPDYLLERDIVYVVFNYRVGIFGFLSTEDTVIPGNWGLKDQVLALEWVQNNIENFGGNASRVTIFGESAGAASVSYLLQTNKTTGLFRQAIMQSGSSLSLWALHRRATRTAFSIGSSLGIITSNSARLLRGLRGVDYETLQETSTAVSTLITLENALQGIFFGPVIEPVHEGALFVSQSDELLRQGGFQKVPLLVGVNSNEAAAVGVLTDIIELYLLTYDIAVENLSPFDINDSYIVRLISGLVIRYHYFGLAPISADSDAVIKFVSDDQFNRPTRRFVQDTSAYVPVYFYKFSYEGNLFGVTNRNFSGVGHAEDIGYLFRVDLTGVNVTETDITVRDTMVKLWTNFAKYGNPTPTADPELQNVIWEPAGTDSSNINYLNINANLTLQQNPFQESMKFYDDLYNMWGDPPYDTY